MLSSHCDVNDNGEVKKKKNVLPIPAVGVELKLDTENKFHQGNVRRTRNIEEMIFLSPLHPKPRVVVLNTKQEARPFL